MPRTTPPTTKMTASKDWEVCVKQWGIHRTISAWHLRFTRLAHSMCRPSHLLRPRNNPTLPLDPRSTGPQDLPYKQTPSRLTTELPLRLLDLHSIALLSRHCQRYRKAPRNLRKAGTTFPAGLHPYRTKLNHRVTIARLLIRIYRAAIPTQVTTGKVAYHTVHATALRTILKLPHLHTPLIPCHLHHSHPPRLHTPHNDGKRDIRHRETILPEMPEPRPQVLRDNIRPIVSWHRLKRRS